jgi:hypothetical protein
MLRNFFFQLALGRAKKQYLKCDPGAESFAPKDVILLVNISWEKLIGQTASARKAVLKRGWHPLNYVLINHPNLVHIPNTTSNVDAVIYGINNSNLDTQLDSQTTFTCSTQGVKMNDFLDKMVEETAKELVIRSITSNKKRTN